jgi:hypothetical protein
MKRVGAESDELNDRFVSIDVLLRGKGQDIINVLPCFDVYRSQLRLGSGKGICLIPSASYACM